jgi:hypothetical protein
VFACDGGGGARVARALLFGDAGGRGAKCKLRRCKIRGFVHISLSDFGALHDGSLDVMRRPKSAQAKVVAFVCARSDLRDLSRGGKRISNGNQTDSKRLKPQKSAGQTDLTDMICIFRSHVQVVNCCNG